MSETPKQVAENIGALVYASPVTALHTARCLRIAGLDLWPQAGAGHRSAHFTASHMINLLLALVAGEPVRGPDLVAEFRDLPSNGELASLFGRNLGELLDSMLEVLVDDNPLDELGKILRSTQIILTIKPTIAAKISAAYPPDYGDTVICGDMPTSTAFSFWRLSGQTMSALAAIWRDASQSQSPPKRVNHEWNHV